MSPAEPDLLEHQRHKIDRPVHPFGRSIGRRTVAWPVYQIEDLVGVGQSNDQRGVTPNPVIGNVHAFLALARGLGDCAIHVDDGFFTEGTILQPPHLSSGFVERFLESEYPIRIETTQEISRRRGIRDPVGTEAVHIGLIVAKPFDVLEAGSAGQHVVGDVQHVIRFPVRDVILEQEDVGY